MLDITISGDILDRTKPQNLEYSCFILKLICDVTLLCAAKSSVPAILPIEYNVLVKSHL